MKLFGIGRPHKKAAFSESLLCWHWLRLLTIWCVIIDKDVWGCYDGSTKKVRQAEAMRRGQRRGGGGPGGNMPGLCSTDSDTESLWAQRASANELLTLAKAAHTAYSLHGASQYGQGYPITAASNWCTALTHFHSLLNRWMLRAEGWLCNRPQCLRPFKIKQKWKCNSRGHSQNLCSTFLFLLFVRKSAYLISRAGYLLSFFDKSTLMITLILKFRQLLYCKNRKCRNMPQRVMHIDSWCSSNDWYSADWIPMSAWRPTHQVNSFEEGSTLKRSCQTVIF